MTEHLQQATTSSLEPSLAQSEKDIFAELSQLGDWQTAVRYHDLREHPGLKKNKRELREISIRAILDRARQVMVSASHDVRIVSEPLAQSDRDRFLELDLEQTLEESLLEFAGRKPLTEDSLWVENRITKKRSIVLCVDTSLSMTGEKMALTAVALAVALLQYRDHPVGVVAFENEASQIRTPSEWVSVEDTIGRFLDLPAQGYTHLEAGLIEALKLERSLSHQGLRPATLLLSDGKYTAGKDPAYLADRFDRLSVIKMGSEEGGWDLCRELAKEGGGAIWRADRIEQLPIVLLDVIRDLLRSRKGAA